MDRLLILSFVASHEGEEIKNNNIGTALITIAIVLGLSIIMDDYVGSLCEALIPYPKTPRIF